MARNITGPTMSASDIRDLMTKHVGVIRDASGLHKAVRLLARQVAAAPGSGSDAALVALLVATAAVTRRESRGAHVRSDHPALGTVRHAEMTLASALKAYRRCRTGRNRTPCKDVA